MAQPPPRKGAYNKFVVNLHKEQYTKLQAKHQQELDLLDDIRYTYIFGILKVWNDLNHKWMYFNIAFYFLTLR